MFNLSSVLTKKADNSAPIDTKLLGCRSNVAKEDLSAAKIYSSIGSHQTIEQSVANSKLVVKKAESDDLWAGSMMGLFS